MEMRENAPAVRSNEPMCFEGDRRPRMLVPVDCTEFSEGVLDTAACTARRLNAEVHLLAVLPDSDHATLQPGPAWYPSYDGDNWTSAGKPGASMVESLDQALDAERQAAADYLRLAAKRFEGLPITMRVLLRKSVALAIVDYARDCSIDLVAMASHGRRPFAQALMGSVASEVLHSGAAPCLLVKPKEG
jgi:nucleotide-binding universal stress UspA family protein